MIVGEELDARCRMLTTWQVLTRPAPCGAARGHGTEDMKRVRRFYRVVGGVLGALSLPFGAGCCVFSAPGYGGSASDHFDGRRFHNQDLIPDHGFSDFLKWQFNRDPGAWNDSMGVEPGQPPPERVGMGELRVTFVNHSTVLIQMDSLNILTDPMWSERCGPVLWAGPRRVRPPWIRFEDLPPVDVVIVSHNHYDHMDVPTLKRLAEEHRPRIFVGLGNGAFLAEKGIGGARDMDWWQSVHLTSDVRLTSVPVQHFSARGTCDRNRTLWTGYVVEGPAGAVYFAGDTGWGRHFEQARERFGPFRLALLPIGAFRPRWFMAPVHLSPEEAVRAHKVLGASTSMAIHFGTFRLGDDGQDEPVEHLVQALADSSLSPERFRVLGFGEGRDVPPVGVPAVARKATYDDGGTSE